MHKLCLFHVAETCQRQLLLPYTQFCYASREGSTTELSNIDGVVVKKLQFKFPLIYCRLCVSSKLFIYSITYPSVWKMNPCLSLRCVFLFRMESADSWVWLQMRTAMQVTDIDSGTSLSIQALEQSGGFFCRRKMLLRSAHNIQRGVRCQPPSLSHEATRE